MWLRIITWVTFEIIQKLIVRQNNPETKYKILHSKFLPKHQALFCKHLTSIIANNILWDQQLFNESFCCISILTCAVILCMVLDKRVKRQKKSNTIDMMRRQYAFQRVRICPVRVRFPESSIVMSSSSSMSSLLNFSVEIIQSCSQSSSEHSELSQQESNSSFSFWVPILFQGTFLEGVDCLYLMS